MKPRRGNRRTVRGGYSLGPLDAVVGCLVPDGAAGAEFRGLREFIVYIPGSDFKVSVLGGK